MHEARVRLGRESDEEMLSGWRMKEVDKFAYSGSMVSASLKELDEENLYFRNRVAVKILEEFTGYCVK